MKPPAIDAERLLRARVDTIASFLPGKIVLNPSWALVAIVPFLGFFPVFGSVEPWRLGTAMMLNVVNSIIAAVLYVRYRNDPLDTRGWLRVFTLFQGQIGLGWGAMVWLLWVPGNPLNHTILLVPLVAILWSNSTACTTFWTLYLAGVLTTFGLALARILIAADAGSGGLAVFFTIAFAYTAIIALNMKKRADGAIATGIANEDLTADLRGARDDALRKRNEAEAANAAKTKFLANISHELRTPLNAILGFSEIIAGESFGPVGAPRYREYARDINASGTHLLSLINDILDIAKIESGKMTIEPELLASQTVIEDTLRVLAERAREKRLKFSVHVAPDAREVWADERAFRQILINLATNAVKFTQAGGRIAVHGRRMPEGGFELLVEDNGPGIEASLLDRIFLPFNQVDDRYNRHEGGTGLGLSLVRGLATLHGGKAWIESADGAGVKAHVYFPAGNSPALAPSSLRLTA